MDEVLYHVTMYKANDERHYYVYAVDKHEAKAKANKEWHEEFKHQPDTHLFPKVESITRMS